MIKISRTVLHNPEKALAREWLVTNGIGGYASSTIIGANTRRYHGLLVSSFPPPMERQVLLAKVDEEVSVGARTYALGTNEYHDGTIHPMGFRSTAAFRLESGIPTWEFRAGGAKLIKQVWMQQGSNTTYLLYRLVESSGPVVLSVRPFCAFRGYHSVGNAGLRVVDYGPGSVSLSDHSSRMSVLLDSTGEFESSPDVYRAFLYRAERERGFGDCVEDLHTPGRFRTELQPGDIFGLTAAVEAAGGSITEALEREVARRNLLVAESSDPVHQSLLLAADQFVVRPRASDGHVSLYAGYPWFTDWGRDTMIALPGILLCFGRFAEARETLLAYADHVLDGLIPNRITDSGTAEYNTVDASLWYFEAIAQYLRASGDSGIIDSLYPALEAIIERYTRGAPQGIRVCSDGLVRAGIEGSQLTWMDARVDGAPVTPRVGKPVEINALWYNALRLMCSWAMHAGKPAAPYEASAGKCQASFARRFWNEDLAYLYDVVDAPDGDDASMRPNQIIAASLPNSPLDVRRQRAVVDAVEQHLLTPWGLRTLSADDPRYRGRYAGGPSERDASYHQGTVWPWLLGHYACAHYRVYRDRAYVRRLLIPFRAHLMEAGVGCVSEVFDGDQPHRPGGCISQAWSVAELLRIISIIA